DRDRRSAAEGDALDHIRIERALRQIFGAAELFRLGLEHLDEQLADDLALAFGIAHPRERFEKHAAGFHMHERNVVAVAKERDDFLRLSEPQEPMIDKDAGELCADRL